jgi:hypothetical protein
MSLKSQVRKLFGAKDKPEAPQVKRDKFGAPKSRG